jgi:triphosphoribosyl-dephospho-CoA synthase
MALAASRDRIANAYVTDFADIFDYALPTLRAAGTGATTDEAVTTLHMALLSRFADSHISRKYGPDTAEAVRADAAAVVAALAGDTAPESRHARLIELDTSLKARGLNPGTTADFVVATVFADCLEAETINPRASKT